MERNFLRSSSRIYSWSTFIQYIYIYIYRYTYIYIYIGLNTTRNLSLKMAHLDCRRVCSIRNNNRFLLNLLFPLKQLSEKVPNKLNALTRITPYLSYNQRRLIYSSFFTGKLSYFLF